MTIPRLRRALARQLGLAGYEVETFASAEAFLGREPWDGVGCLVLDQSMPGMQGTELQEELERRGIRLPIVFLTGFPDIETGVTAIRRGAVDFLVKPDGVLRLPAAVDSALAISHRAAQLRALVGRLSPREREVLALVIAGEPNKRIAAALGIGEDGVKFHRRRLMRKLEVDSLAALVRLCVEAGVEPAEAAP